MSDKPTLPAQALTIPLETAGHPGDLEMPCPPLRCGLCHDWLLSHPSYTAATTVEHMLRHAGADPCPNEGKFWKVPAIPVYAQEIDA